MDFYVVLTLATAAIVALAALLSVITRQISVLAGIGLLYYWSLYGAWSIIGAHLGGESDKQYDYLAERMFPIQLNDDYMMALVLYAAFIILVELTLVWKISGRSVVRESLAVAPIRISHGSLFILATISVIGSFIILAEQLTSAAEMNMSAYVATRGGLGAYHPLFTIHQVFNRLAVFSLAIGFAVYLTPRRALFIEGSHSLGIGVTYVFLLVGTLGYLAMLGNKNELLSALLLGGLFYSTNTARIQWKLAIPIGLVVFLFIGAINFLRSLPMLALLNTDTWWEALVEAPGIHSSGEAFAAHFSLYGVLESHAPLTYGSSFMLLAASLVPSVLRGERSLGTYTVYAESLGIYEGATGEAYTLHHATGWYLNFGLWGIVAGAVLLGVLWGWCYTAHVKANRGDRRWQNLLAIVAPSGLVSAIPPLVRAGPDAYKGLLIEAFILPTLALWWATIWRTRKSSKEV